MAKDDLTILVVSTKSYSDLWEGFFSCKENFWNDCPYHTVLSTDVNNYTRQGVEVISTGTYSEWSVRAKNALNKIKTKYVCFLLEDFYITKKVDTKKIEQALEIMKRDNIRHYKLFSLSKIKTPTYKENEYILTIPESLPYGLSLIAGIWEKDFFLQKIGNGIYNPWKFEVDRLEEEKKSNGSMRLVGLFDKRNILNITHMVVQGKYLRKSYKTISKINPSYLSNTRKKMSLIDALLYRSKSMLSDLKKNSHFVEYLLSPLNKYSVTSRNK